tara:strand:- start:442 stop:717 length:276 start_codon:yes stop_codon:yes gene_type:complete
MAIIRYQLDNGNTPSYITDGGHFYSGNNLIGIGSGGGTEISKSDLLTYVLSLHASTPYKTRDSDQMLTDTNMNTTQVTGLVNSWCSVRGIS